MHVLRCTAGQLWTWGFGSAFEGRQRPTLKISCDDHAAKLAAVTAWLAQGGTSITTPAIWPSGRQVRRSEYSIKNCIDNEESSASSEHLGFPLVGCMPSRATCGGGHQGRGLSDKRSRIFLARISRKRFERSGELRCAISRKACDFPDER
jgi:hypothetical protein